MENGRGTGRSPHAQPNPRRRAWALAAGIAVVAAAVALAIAELGGGGLPAAQRLAGNFAHAWSKRDWRALYRDLDARAHSALPFSTFVAIERGDADLATTASAVVGAPSALAGGRVSVPVTVGTRIFGTLDERFVLTITGPSSSPAVAWNAPAAFPGLLPGEQLRRVDTAPARGQLLARDGSPLADLVSASNVIGSVGEASGALLEQTVAAGFPASTPVGLDGLEAVFQPQLGGRPGGSLYAGTRLLATAAARPGRDVRTSISAPLQTLAVSELGTSLGGIVVMEPDTGEVLAAAGAPLSELQPPGSTFKIITLTAVLESHLGTAASVYHYATSATLDGFVLHNANGEDCGGTLANAFAVSCNSVFAPLGARLGAGDLLHAADAYGFNAPSPIPIAAESSVPPASLTDSLQLGESAIGQAQVEASPLQMARVAATIALVGRRPVPTFALVGHRPLFPRVIPVSVARTVRALMHDVVSYGTGTSAQIPGVVVAGKTGTAEVVTPPPCTATGASGTHRHRRRRDACGDGRAGGARGLGGRGARPRGGGRHGRRGGPPGLRRCERSGGGSRRRWCRRPGGRRHHRNGRRERERLWRGRTSAGTGGAGGTAPATGSGSSTVRPAARRPDRPPRRRRPDRPGRRTAAAPTPTPTTPTPGSSPSHPRSIRASSSPCCSPTTAPAARRPRRSRRRSSSRRSRPAPERRARAGRRRSRGGSRAGESRRQAQPGRGAASLPRRAAAYSTKASSACGSASASRLATSAAGAPSRMRLTGSSSFFAVSVRGIAGTASTVSGTCRGESAPRSAVMIRVRSASSKLTPSASTTNRISSPGPPSAILQMHDEAVERPPRAPRSPGRTRPCRAARRRGSASRPSGR